MENYYFFYSIKPTIKVWCIIVKIKARKFTVWSGYIYLWKNTLAIKCLWQQMLLNWFCFKLCPRYSSTAGSNCEVIKNSFDVKFNWIWTLSRKNCELQILELNSFTGLISFLNGHFSIKVAHVAKILSNFILKKSWSKREKIFRGKTCRQVREVFKTSY